MESFLASLIAAKENSFIPQHRAIVLEQTSAKPKHSPLPTEDLEESNKSFSQTHFSHSTDSSQDIVLQDNGLQTKVVHLELISIEMSQRMSRIETQQSSLLELQQNVLALLQDVKSNQATRI